MIPKSLLSTTTLDCLSFYDSVYSHILHKASKADESLESPCGGKEKIQTSLYFTLSHLILSLPASSPTPNLHFVVLYNLSSEKFKVFPMLTL